ncbi:MAG: DUF3857 domain-containing protein [Algicola sp.]|nr:DUF3857 domain-containing protein [Algicola sp.]
MRNLLSLLALLITLSSISQSKEALEAKAFFWGANDAYKNATEIPEEWLNESAVIIYKNENYDFHKFGKNVTYTTSIRKRFKLLDKAALEEFSEFSFRKRFYSSKGQISWLARKGNTLVGIKIVKPDGTEIEIDVDKEAVEVDGETKLAISNLEVGDIIDYYYYKREPFKSTYAFGFDPVEKPLAEDYPIMEYKLFFETENDFFINFNSFNGAPDLKEIPTEKRNMRRYELTENNIPKSEYTRWFYPLVELPSYKFQVYFARSGKFEDRALAFLPEKEDIIKTKVSKEEVLDLYDKRFKPDGDVGDVKDYFKNKIFNNDSEKVKAAYYYMRHYYLTRYIEAFYAKEASIAPYSFMVYGNDVIFIQNQKQFVRHFTEFLKRQKIDYDIVVGKKRYDGTMDELLIEKNVEVLIKVNTTTPLYAKFFSPHTNINEFSPLMEGTDVFLLSSEKTKRIIDVVENGKLPSSTYNDNETKKVVTVTLNDDFSGVAIESVNSYKGHEKTDQLYDRLIFSDYVYEDYKKYETETWIDLVRKKHKEKYQTEINALIDKLKTKQKESFENATKGEYGVENIEDYTFNINENGRFSFDDYFTFTESFSAKDGLIKKAGPNVIVEIGQLIGGQIDLNEKERQRTADIHMPYPRSFNYTIKLNIPIGYTVSGLENLTKNVDNETGAFISSATMEGNQLIVKTSKQYKHNFEPKENWNKMIAFLDEAHQFTEEKILLKKQ